MKGKITERAVESVVPGPRDAFLWDTELPGFGLKVTPKGARIYIVQFWRGGRSRRYRLGLHGVDLTPDEARRAAQRLRGRVAAGHDPAAERAAERAVPTLSAVADRYMSEHAEVKKKASSAAEDRRNLRKHILPKMGTWKVDTITGADIVRFHSGMKATPGAANRCLALLSKMFNLAERWGYRLDGTNPTRHVDKYPERTVERFLSGAELARLGAALSEAERAGTHPSVVAALRLLIFTGCRRSEVLTLKWEHVDVERGCLRLPDRKTGAKMVPLGAPAVELLAALPRIDGNPYVLPGAVPGGHYVGLAKAWYRLRKRAGLDDVRLHDLRHSFASAGAGMGESLLLIGALLGHSNTAMTARYAHLSSDPLKAAADRISGKIAAAMNGESGEVVPIGAGRK